MHLRKAQGADTLKLELLGARREGVAMAGEAALPGVTNYLQGNNRQQWRTGVAHYARVRYREVYAGIDLVFYGNEAGDLEYDLVVKPGARPEAIRLRFQGQKRQSISAEGDLVFALSGGEVRQKRPHVFQETATGRQEIASAYVLRADGTVGLRLGAWDRGRDLVVDPVISYGTYWGGSGDEVSPQIAVDGQGNVYLFGDTNSGNFVTTTGAYKTQRPGGQFDNYITKFGPDGKVIWSTFFGGGQDDTAKALAVDGAGAVYLAGNTNSSDLPITLGAPQARRGLGGQRNEDGFVAKLNATGTAVVWCTYLGGNNDDNIAGMALGPAGEVYVAGDTLASDFPTTAGVLKRVDNAVLFEGFVTKINAAGTEFSYSTYVGGTGSEQITDIAVDARGNAYVCGLSLSRDFPVTPGALQVNRLGDTDMFVMKINPTGTAAVYSTLLGGGTTGEEAYAIAVDANGAAYVVGATTAIDFPVTNPIQRTRLVSPDGFIAKLNPEGSALVYASYLGGNGPDFAESVAVDSTGSAYVLLTTGSVTGLTPVQPFQSSNAGSTDMYVMKLSPDGTTVQHASFLGGTGGEIARSIAIDNRERAYVSGSTGSNTMPGTLGSQQPNLGGARDSYWARVDFAAPPVTLTVAPTALGASGQVGGTIARQQLSIAAQTGQRPDWNLEVTTQSGGQWLEVTPLSGSGSATVDVNYRTGALAAGTYVGTITLVNRSANTRTPVQVTMTLTAAPPNPGGLLTSAGILSAASFQGGGVSPGLIVTIFGQRIGPDRLVSSAVGSDLKFPTTVSDTRVLFDGVPAPLIYVSATQVSAIVPYAVATRTTSDVVIEYRGNRSNAVSVPVVAAKPGLFTANASGSGPGAIQNQDFSVNTPSNPAARGSIIVLYGTGEGVTDPAGVDGQVAASVFPKPRQNVSVRIGGVMAEVLYAGAAPSLVAGVVQVNVKVPDNVPDGNVPIQLLVGNTESPSGVTVAVQGDLTTKN